MDSSPEDWYKEAHSLAPQNLGKDDSAVPELPSSPQRSLPGDDSDTANPSYATDEVTAICTQDIPPMEQFNRNVGIVPDGNPLNPLPFKSPAQKLKLPASRTASSDDHLPGQASDPTRTFRTGTWNHGLFSCSETGICCIGIFCPCITYGMTQHRLSQRAEKKDPNDMLGHSKLNGSCLAFAFLFCGCNVLLAAIQHARVRQTYNITNRDGTKGSIQTDFAHACCCCCCCTLSQDEKEVRQRESRARTVPMSSMRYVSPDGMSFAPPPLPQPP